MKSPFPEMAGRTVRSNFISRQRTFWIRLFRRDSAESGPVTLTRRRVYILPSRNGVIFSILLLAMLVGAINYQNSLSFIFTFLLAGLAVVSMVHTFRNLNGLRFRTGHIPPVFAGEQAAFPLSVENPQGPPRYAIKILFAGQQPQTLDLDLNGGQWLELHHPTTQRGWLTPGRIIVYSRFPLGLFHAWAYLHIEMRALVYPVPSMERKLPRELLVQNGSSGDQGKGDDDFASLRPYHPGDSLRHVNWKALAREQGLMTKQFGGGVSEELWLKWEMLGNLPQEAKLSRLTRWVLEADSHGMAYGLHLPHQIIAPQRGDSHRRQCLQALALFNLPSQPAGGAG
jgi:uncharacterized protein (DUF58 family)